MQLKLNLLVHKIEFINGYKNISPFAPVDDNRFARNSVIDLEMLADDGEIHEIRALDVLEYYPYQDLDTILNEWVSKLAHGGTLTIGGTDIGFTARAINTRDLNQDSILKQLYGEANKAKKAAYSISYIVAKLKERGLKITIKKLMPDGQFIVTGERQ